MSGYQRDDTEPQRNTHSNLGEHSRNQLIDPQLQGLDLLVQKERDYGGMLISREHAGHPGDCPGHSSTCVRFVSIVIAKDCRCQRTPEMEVFPPTKEK